MLGFRCGIQPMCPCPSTLTLPHPGKWGQVCLRELVLQEHMCWKNSEQSNKQNKFSQSTLKLFIYLTISCLCFPNPPGFSLEPAFSPILGLYIQGTPGCNSQGDIKHLQSPALQCLLWPSGHPSLPHVLPGQYDLPSILWIPLSTFTSGSAAAPRELTRHP